MSQPFTHCIVAVVDDYAMARGNHDVEYVVCKMTDGRQKTLENDDPDFEEFVADRAAYWEARGWKLIEKEGRKTLSAMHHAQQP